MGSVSEPRHTLSLRDRVRSQVWWYQYLVREWKRDRVPRWVSYLLPRRIVYFCVIRAWVFSQSGKYATEHPTDVRTFDTARRWDEQDH